MISFWKGWFLTPRAYIILFGLSVPAVLSVWVNVLYPVTLAALVLFTIAILIDTTWLWSKGRMVHARRRLEERLNNGEPNIVRIRLKSLYPSTITASVVDELPIQFQERDFHLHVRLDGGQERDVSYSVRPVERGVYSFGAVNVFVKGPLGLVERRFRWDADHECKVYPSVTVMRKAELHAFSNRLVKHGQRRLRRLGHTMDFEKIKNYVSGDDVRSLNWKATARSGNLMVNQYQDERSQDVVAVLDTGRIMRAPFDGMTSLDYAINAALAFSNVVIKKHDRAGLITYGAHGSSMVTPGSKPEQIVQINETLYALQTDFEETNDEHLVLRIRTSLRHRSLVMLFTNIDSMSALHRRLPYFQLIATRHVLVVVIFENVEVRALAASRAATIEDVYKRTVARDFLQQKRDIAMELRHRGIHCVLAAPTQLSIASIDRYLELKTRGLI